MPIYEYQCLKCGQRFELRRSMTESDSDVRCPKCGAEHPQRVFSVFATSSSASTCTPSGST
ncbi:MAG: zinc ribbon domain-containing protein [Chloroflexi bacterium]|nr:MAG: zinc ribbon domain-containing protein [Chloroflexota bacterium]